MRGGWKTRGRCHVFGDGIIHDNGMMEFKQVAERQTDPAILIPLLFKAIDPEFATRVQPGDFIVAGRRFGSGKAHTTAYVAIEALNIRILCESTFERVIRGAVNLGVPIMGQCSNITSVVRTGDDAEVDMSTGEFTNMSTGESFTYPPIQPGMRDVLQDGGRKGFLQKWLVTHPELGAAMAGDQ